MERELATVLSQTLEKRSIPRSRSARRIPPWRRRGACTAYRRR
jgi:hypothetical protein